MDRGQPPTGEPAPHDDAPGDEAAGLERTLPRPRTRSAIERLAASQSAMADLEKRIVALAEALERRLAEEQRPPPN